MRGLALAFLMPTVIFAQSRGEPVDPANGPNPRPMIVGGTQNMGGTFMVVVPGQRTNGGRANPGYMNDPGMTRFGGGGGRGGGDIMERATVKKRGVKQDAFPGIQRVRITGEDITL